MGKPSGVWQAPDIADPTSPAKAAGQSPMFCKSACKQISPFGSRIGLIEISPRENTCIQLNSEPLVNERPQRLDEIASQ